MTTPYSYTLEEFYAIPPPPEFADAVIDVIEEPSSFTVSEVEEMCDEKLLENFSRVTGKQYLSCAHCHYDKVELSAFVRVIRKWCLKKQNSGIHIKMTVPKTCDRQSFANLKRQPYYTKIKKAVSDDCAESIKTENRHLFVVERKKYTRRVK